MIIFSLGQEGDVFFVNFGQESDVVSVNFGQENKKKFNFLSKIFELFVEQGGDGGRIWARNVLENNKLAQIPPPTRWNPAAS